MKRCPTCNKLRFFLKQRRVYIEPMNLYVTSQEKICRKCANEFKTI